MKNTNKVVKITTKKGIKELNKFLAQGWEIADENEYEVKLYKPNKKVLSSLGV